MKTRAVILLVLVSLLVSVAAVANASPRDDFSLEKTCMSLTPGMEENACDISEATGPMAMFNGGWIVYQDRVYWEKGDKVREIARVHLVAPSGDTLRGQIRWLDDGGMFTFSKGTGAAAGIHGNGLISYVGSETDGRALFSLTGTYHVEK
jgi:hypothetical protein